MGNAVSENNNRVLATVARSDADLPEIIAVWRHSREGRSGQNSSAALFRCEADGWHRGAWKLTFIENPIEHIGDGQLVASNEDEWLGAQPHNILIKRVHPDPNLNDRFNETKIIYIGYKITSNQGGRAIPVMNLNRKSEVLPYEFASLDAPRNGHLRFTMRLGRLVNPYTYRILQRDPILAAASEFVRGELPRPPAPAARLVSLPPPPPRMPQHVVNVYLDSLISVKKDCPVAFEEMSRENACMAPCGHAMIYSAVESWLRASRTCPVCRTALSLEDLIKWKE